MSSPRFQSYPGLPGTPPTAQASPARPFQPFQAFQTTPPLIDSRQLLAPGQTTLTIAHAGQRYLLRVTRENKLILTK